MKTFNFLNIVFIIWITFSTGCDSPLEPRKTDPLIGNWLLKVVSGGFVGIDTIDTSKERWIISFLKENKAIYSYNDSVLWQTSFHIEKKERSSDSLRFIIYENNFTPEVIVYLKKDTLCLSNSYVDGFTKWYIRLYGLGKF